MRTKASQEGTHMVNTYQILVCDPPWGIFKSKSAGEGPVWDHFDLNDEHTVNLANNIAVIAHQRLSPTGVIFLFVPPTLVDPVKNVVAITCKGVFERCVK
jgi:hypothetical protein